MAILAAVVALVIFLSLSGYVVEVRLSRPRREARETQEAMQRYRRASREWEALYRGLMSAMDDVIQARDNDDPNFEEMKAKIEERVRSRVAEARGDIDP